MRNFGWETFGQPCEHCGLPPRKTGEDACLGHLPGVVSGCCGHGTEEGYLIFENGIQLEFQLSRPPTRATPSRELETTETVGPQGPFSLGGAHD